MCAGWADKRQAKVTFRGQMSRRHANQSRQGVGVDLDLLMTNDSLADEELMTN